MKIRNSFVSNSSSSSFVVMYNGDAKLSLCLPGASEPCLELSVEEFMDMLDECGGWRCESSGVRAVGIDEVCRRLASDSYCWTDGAESPEEVRRDECSRKIRRQMDESSMSEVAELEISYSDRQLKKIFDAFVRAGLIKEAKD